jgi:acyl carrier protein
MLEDERLPNAQDARSALRKWLLARDPKLRPETLTARTLLLEARIVTSLQLMDLVLFVEELRGRAIAPESLRPEAFASIDAICATWLEDNAP